MRHGRTEAGGLRRLAGAILAAAVLATCADEATPPGASTGSGAGAGGVDGGGGSGGELVLPPPLGPIAPVASTSTDRFVTSRACNQCHYAGTSDVMHDPETGEDLSPGYQWQSSMMAFAARDPYYLAVVSEELEAAGDAREAVEAVCLRCHAPAGAEEAAGAGEHLSLDELLTGGSPAANLGRDGVACALCHQIEPDGLGEVESFSGGFTVGYDRRLYGPHTSPNTQPMEFFVDYTPVHAEHVLEASLCATCHTVVTPVTDADGDVVGDFVEQAPFLEWQNSAYAETQPCNTCHLAATDSTGLPIQTPIATYPEDLAPRSFYGTHSFVGANAYMLSILADEIEWTGASVEPAQLEEAAARSRTHLEGAARVLVDALTPDGDDLVATVRVVNQAGHKLPTGYPGRRLWLHVRAFDGADAVVFESGAWDRAGHVLAADGTPVDEGGLVPHLDEVGPGQVQIWESVPGDLDGAPTHRPLAAASYLKDDRILPAGWEADGPWTSWTQPVGVDGDADFVAASDRVRVRIPGGASVARVEVALVYQTLSPAALAHLRRVPTPAAVRFTLMTDARPPEAYVVATAERAR